MSSERFRQQIKENPLVKGGLYFVAGMVILGFSIGLVNEALALA